MPENVAVGLLPPDHKEVITHRYRYEVAARFARGNVLDAACGWGYGSAMLADIEGIGNVLGVDRDETAIWHAKKLYKKPGFRCCDIGTTCFGDDFDTIVSIETLEHLKDPAAMVRYWSDFAMRFVASVPIIPTKHVNPYHLHDFTRDSIVDLFDGWELMHEEIQRGVYFIGVFDR